MIALSKKQIGVGLSTVALATSGVLAVPQFASGEWNINDVVQKQQDQQEQLTNHETRISSTENNVKDLQGATASPSSAPSMAHTATPISTSTQTASTAGAAVPPAPATESSAVPQVSDGAPAQQPSITYTIPTTDEINAWFSDIAPAGQMRAEKLAICKTNFANRGFPTQGNQVCVGYNLENYPNY